MRRCASLNALPNRAGASSFRPISIAQGREKPILSRAPSAWQAQISSGSLHRPLIGAFFTKAGYPDAKYLFCDGRIPCAVAILQKK